MNDKLLLYSHHLLTGVVGVGEGGGEGRLDALLRTRMTSVGQYDGSSTGHSDGNFEEMVVLDIPGHIGGGTSHHRGIISQYGGTVSHPPALPG